MRNKAKRYSILLVGLALLLTGTAISCGSHANKVSNNKHSDDIELIKEMAVYLRMYTLELKHAEAIRNESLEQIGNALTGGEITTFEYRKRVYQIYLIEANTIKFIDSKPHYNRLHSFMWIEDGKPPELAWSILEAQSDPEKREAQFEDYLHAYIFRHHHVVEELTNFLLEQADELGVEITLPVERFYGDS